jgi:hypothetical protein
MEEKEANKKKHASMLFSACFQGCFNYHFHFEGEEMEALRS